MKQNRPTEKQTLERQQWQQTHKQALEDYRQAVWNLAECMSEGKRLFGRDNLAKITPLDLAKLRWLCSITEVTARNDSLLPEHHYECAGLNRAKPWLDKAAENNWKPTELRKALRKSNKQFTEDKPIAVSKWPKYSLLIQAELKNLPPEQRQKALEMLQRQFVANN